MARVLPSALLLLPSLFFAVRPMMADRRLLPAVLARLATLD
jgi:hypothetical protein